MAKSTSLRDVVKSLPPSKIGRRISWEAELEKSKPKVWAEVAEIIDGFIAGDNEIVRKLPSKKHLWQFLDTYINDGRQYCGEAGFLNMLRRRERANG